MKQVASPLMLHSPIPIRNMQYPSIYSKTKLLAASIPCRHLPSDNFFLSQLEGNSLESLINFNTKSEESKLSELAEIERELFRRPKSFSTIENTERRQENNGIQSRHSCPVLFAPERPSNPMINDNMFRNDDENMNCSDNE